MGVLSQVDVKVIWKTGWREKEKIDFIDYGLHLRSYGNFSEQTDKIKY